MNSSARPSSTAPRRALASGDPIVVAYPEPTGRASWTHALAGRTGIRLV